MIRKQKMTQKEINKSTKEFGRIFSKAQMKVINLLLAAKVFTSQENDTTLMGIAIVLNALNKKSDKWIDRNISKYYKTGSREVSQILNEPMLFSPKDKLMLKTLTEDAKSSMGDAITGIHRSSSRILNWATRQKLETRIKEGSISGESLKQITDALAGKLKDRAVYLIDSAGRKWDIENYSEMYARTEMMNSYNKGVANQLVQKGQDLSYVTSYASCQCDVCQAWQGKVLSLTGKTKGYPTLEDAYRDGLFHPNCKHRLRPYTGTVA